MQPVETLNYQEIRARRDSNDRVLMTTLLELSGVSIEHSRKIYGLLDVVGDFGGVYEVLMLLGFLFLSPWSEFKYASKAIQKMYLVRTKARGLFRDTQSEKNLNRLDKLYATKEAEDIKIAKLDLCEELRLFFKEKFCSSCADTEPKNISDKVQRWYRMGRLRLEKELNIVKIIGDLRDLRLLTKDARKHGNAKHRMQVMGKNVIELDSDKDLEEPSFSLFKEPARFNTF